jgi:hypothetical protein
MFMRLQCPIVLARRNNDCCNSANCGQCGWFHRVQIVLMATAPGTIGGIQSCTRVSIRAQEVELKVHQFNRD